LIILFDPLSVIADVPGAMFPIIILLEFVLSVAKGNSLSAMLATVSAIEST